MAATFGATLVERGLQGCLWWPPWPKAMRINDGFQKRFVGFTFGFAGEGTLNAVAGSWWPLQVRPRSTMVIDAVAVVFRGAKTP